MNKLDLAKELFHLYSEKNLREFHKLKTNEQERWLRIADWIKYKTNCFSRLDELEKRIGYLEEDSE